ncbi:GNAT family N-acetyltransferase [Paenibacillus aurantius]|uniref:GNAT family N-acetyltransferase n=1 Tax=Paenibacillus aurantius TaxID=2918900 RepID=A0AA96LH03_9BACL|nr:GNAT family N-acetyltransferase [Paenibacillus aurantius]WNQ11312.1 GNAT family N-acetyltransferase [Paenibacillus aurantius]
MSRETDRGGAAGGLVIECRDILLRGFRAEDLEAFHALTWQPEIHRWLPGWNVPLETRRDWLLNYEIKENQEVERSLATTGRIQDLRLRLGICTKDTGEFIGWCCSGIKEELPPPNREIVYAISRDYRGKGYTTQAAEGLIRFLFTRTEVEWLAAVALLTNTPSNRVIGKCGFTLVGQMEINDEGYNHYLLCRSEWEGRQPGGKGERGISRNEGG